MTTNAEVSALLSQVLALQTASAAKIDAIAQTVATLQSTIEALEAGGINPELLAQAQALLDKATANDAALAAIQGAN